MLLDFDEIIGQTNRFLTGSGHKSAGNSKRCSASIYYDVSYLILDGLNELRREIKTTLLTLNARIVTFERQCHTNYGKLRTSALRSARCVSARQ